jgi:FixJ family two-component response regulator
MSLEPTVFVVDDDSFMRELLQTVFGDAGIPVHTFASADELLSQAVLRAPCVLLLDVRMPGMSGPELQARLRENGVRAPIIFLTGFSDVPVAVAAMRNGAFDFLVKPFDRETLVDRVRQAFATYYEPHDPQAASDYALRVTTLTPRERQVFELMLTGMSSKHIARTLDCSFRTIDIHRGRVMTKMAAGSLAELVRMSAEGQALT